MSEPNDRRPTTEAPGADALECHNFEDTIQLRVPRR